MENNINREDFSWTDKPVIGLALKIAGGEVDSFGANINGDVYYEVGKHKESGMVAIFPTDRNQKNELVNRIMNASNRFN